MLDHFIAKNATAHKVNSYCTVAISYCTFCVEQHTILGPACSCKISSSKVQRFMSYPVNKEKKLSDDAENNTAVASAGSNNWKDFYLIP